MKDAWESGDPYKYFMGRWSSLVARSFVDWLSPPPGLRWLDVGCGSGALSQAVFDSVKPAALTAVDQSAGFVESAQRRLGDRAHCQVGSALALPLNDSSVDFTISGLMLNFISEPDKALAEMKRVTTSGGTAASYIWDYAETMDFLNHFWDAAVELDPAAAALHEGRRFPDANAEELSALFDRAGFEEIETAPVDIVTQFRNFDDYWQPFLGGQGPAPTYLLSLDDADKDTLRDLVLDRLPILADGSISMSARAWAIIGQA